MPEPVHLLTQPRGDLRQVGIVCGALDATCATWLREGVTCVACLAPAPTRAHASSSTGVTEKQWLQQVSTLARSRGYLVYHTHNSQKSASGWPDLALAKADSPLYLVELKTNHGAFRGHQRLWIDTLRQTTGLVVEVWRPEQWDQVVQVLTGSHTPII